MLFFKEYMIIKIKILKIPKKIKKKMILSINVKIKNKFQSVCLSGSSLLSKPISLSIFYTLVL